MNILKKHFMSNIVMFHDWDGKSVVIHVLIFMHSRYIKYNNPGMADEYNDNLAKYQNQCLSKINEIYKIIKMSSYVPIRKSLYELVK